VSEVLDLLNDIIEFYRGRPDLPGAQEIAEYVESWAILFRNGDMAGIDTRIEQWRRENNEGT
jgi:hypothetical protein